MKLVYKLNCIFFSLKGQPRVATPIRPGMRPQTSIQGQGTRQAIVMSRAQGSQGHIVVVTNPQGMKVATPGSVTTQSGMFLF